MDGLCTGRTWRWGGMRYVHSHAHPGDKTRKNLTVLAVPPSGRQKKKKKHKVITKADVKTVLIFNQSQAKSFLYPTGTMYFLRPVYLGILSLDDPANEVRTVDRVSLLDLQACHLAAVGGRDDHLLYAETLVSQCHLYTASG